MPRKLIIFLVILLLGTWFIVDEDRSLIDKIMLIFVIIAVYVIFRILTGANLPEIIAPILGR